MSSNIERDERTVVVEKASYSLAYIFMGFALLLDIAYRSFVKGESSFDLLAIIVLSGFISTVYQAKHKILNQGWVKLIILAISISVFIAILITKLS